MLPLGEGWGLLDGLYEDAQRNRARVTSWWKDNPPTGAVRAPVVIAGAYRTGTTFLHRALAQALPGYRTLLGWEATIPTPPPNPNLYARLRDPRCGQQQAATDALYELDSELRDLHYEPADLPAECVQAMAMTGLTGLWPAICSCPEYVDFLFSESGEREYLFYDLALRTLEPNARWLLKSPMHSLFLPTIFRVWPDAIVIRVKRDHDSTVRSAVKFFDHLRALSRPGDHTEELEEWVPEYLWEHNIRCDRAEQAGQQVITIDAIDLLQDSDRVVHLLKERIHADIHA